ncbi:hypothetical protein [Myceligenerans crystallogenes]|uniref:Uncharacterized protein n=1 Tax=Myceligenerans crystallogenes TaxID=316335 RepID=A0ABN2NDN9_9MICO
MDAAIRMQSIIAAAERSRPLGNRPQRVRPAPGEGNAGDTLTTDPQDRKRRAHAALLDLVEQTAAKRRR